MIKAVPTAEGAIQIALEKMPTTLAWSNSLVIGNGRIGKILSKKISDLGSNVTVTARKPCDFADILSNNMKFAKINEIENFDFDIIFNTVPAPVLKERELAKIPQETIIIDLASKPGGVDFEVAKRMSKNVTWALSLPGKVAPKTSAKFIFDTILSILHEMEVN